MMRFKSVIGSLVLLGMLLSSHGPNSRVAADLFVSAAGANSVMRFDADTGDFLGNFVAPGSGGLGDPQGIAFGPDGNLYVASNTSNNVLRYNGETGAFIDVFASIAGTSWPAEINFRGDYLYVSDFGGSGRVTRFDALTGSFVDHFVTDAFQADGQSWDSNGDLYVSAWGTASIRKYDGDTGTYLGDFVSPGTGGLNGPLDNLFLPNGDMLVSSFNTGSIKHYDSDGDYIGDAITGLFGPQGLQMGPDGLLYVGDFGTGIIRRYDPKSLQLIDQFADATSTTNNFVFSPATIPEPGTTPVVCLAVAWFCRRKNRSGN